MAENSLQRFFCVAGNSAVISPADAQRRLRRSVLNAIEPCVVSNGLLKQTLLVNTQWPQRRTPFGCSKIVWTV